MPELRARPDSYHGALLQLHGAAQTQTIERKSDSAFALHANNSLLIVAEVEQQPRAGLPVIFEAARPATAGGERFYRRRAPLLHPHLDGRRLTADPLALQRRTLFSPDSAALYARHDMSRLSRNHSGLTEQNMDRLNGAMGDSERDESVAEDVGHNAQHGITNGDANEDLFLEVAHDDAEPLSQYRTQRASTRASYHSKRRSLQADPSMLSPERLRPKSSGHIEGGAPPPVGYFPTALSQKSRRFRETPNLASRSRDDEPSPSGVSTVERRLRYAETPLRSPMFAAGRRESTASPEMAQYGRRRPSSGTPDISSPNTQRNRQSTLARLQEGYSDSPAEGSEPKRSQLESSSVESDAAPSTVWTELDELKSRIKKLELTGNVPASSPAAHSGDTNERPRTATTAPTTIDSSPKRTPKPDAESPAAGTGIGGSAAANIYPLLHSALAKAKPLMDANMYRALEATAGDALELAVLTGSAGPQGTAFSAASIINGVTASDRHVRRKADTMCRNLTDLCIALCDGRYEAPKVAQSPMTTDNIMNNTPPARRSRTSMGSDLARGLPSRAASRLESRRASILGFNRSPGNSPRMTSESISGQELDSPSQPTENQSRSFSSRTGTSLLRTRPSRLMSEDDGGDEDPTIRPLSRAATEFSQLRSQTRDRRDSSQPQHQQSQQSPSLRDTLNARRANAGAHESNNGKLRAVSSGTSSDFRSRFRRDSTPPTVLEENAYEPQLLQLQSEKSRRRVSSLNPYGGAGRAPDFGPSGRASSFGLRS